jgi:hypothetical protein
MSGAEIREAEAATTSATGDQTTLTITFMCSRCGRVLGTYTGKYFVAKGLERILCLECYTEMFGSKVEGR